MAARCIVQKSRQSEFRSRRPPGSAPQNVPFCWVYANFQL